MAKTREGVKQRHKGQSVNRAARGGLLGEMVCELRLKEKWNFRSGGGGFQGKGRCEAMPSSVSLLVLAFFLPVPHPHGG